MNLLPAILSATTGEVQSTGSMLIMMVFYFLFFGVLIYFMIIRPQKKQQRKQDELMNSLALGDSVLTTSGFYGVIIDMVDEDVVIVEFGNNKHCRIPMRKTSIIEVEKPVKE